MTPGHTNSLIPIEDGRMRFAARAPGWSCRGAFTLIEVVAGLSLMSMVLVVCLVAIHRHEQQSNTAHQKLLAVRVADHLLEDLHGGGRLSPMLRTGSVSSDGHDFERI